MIKLLRKLKLGYWRLKYIKFPIWHEMWSGRADPDKSNIVSFKTTDRPILSKDWAIVLMWSPEGTIKKTFENLLITLRSCDVNVVLVCNHELSKLQEEELSKSANFILIRNNRGLDIGGYKDAFIFLKNQSLQIERLGFFNDSVFYIENGLKTCISQLFSSDADVCALMENWEIEPHFQSFGIVLSGHLANHSSIKAFWKEYVPVTNRTYAIKKGEIGFSRVLKRVMNSSQVLYGAENLLDAIHHDLQGDAIVSKAFRESWLPSRDYTNFFAPKRPLHNEFYGIDLNVKDPMDRIRMKLQHVYKFFPGKNLSHSGALFLIKYMNCPIIKKDLVYKESFIFSELIRNLIEVSDQLELNEIGIDLRKKGIGRQLTGIDKKKYLIGVR